MLWIVAAFLPTAWTTKSKTMQGVFLKCYPVYISDFENAIFQFWLMAKGELFPVLFVAAGYLYAALPTQPEPLNLTKKAS